MVRFTPNSDRESGHDHCGMSALPPKADMCSANRHVRFGPEADMQHKLLLFADTTFLIPANGVLKTIIAPKQLSID
jgi:hypothetical protein